MQQMSWSCAVQLFQAVRQDCCCTGSGLFTPFTITHCAVQTDLELYVEHSGLELEILLPRLLKC